MEKRNAFAAALKVGKDCILVQSHPHYKLIQSRLLPNPIRLPYIILPHRFALHHGGALVWTATISNNGVAAVPLTALKRS